MAATKEKQYGLINMKKTKSSQPLQEKLAVFDDSDEEETEQSAVNQKLLQEAVKTKMRKQTRMEIQKAMEEDPTVYEYDSIYDSMEAKKLERERMKKIKQRDSKPKYIEGLMKAAKQRKMERERQKERMIQKEREKEGEQFGDKEQFVTASYKKKMQELAEDEERERREAERDGDPSKGLDMAGFYRHILDQTTGEKDATSIKRESSPSVTPKEGKESGQDDSRHKTKDKKDSRWGVDRGDTQERKGDYEDRDRHSGKSDREPRGQRGSRYEKDMGRDRTERGYKRQDERDREREHGRERDVGVSRDDKKGRRDREREEDRKKGKDRDSNKESSWRRHDEKKDMGGRHRRDESNGRSLGKTTGTLQRDRAGYRAHSEECRESEGKMEDDGKNKVEEEAKHPERRVPETNPDADSDLDISEESEDESEKGDEPQVEPTADEKEVDEERTHEEKVKAKYARRTTEDTVMSARERYMARKMQRDARKEHVAVEDDD